MKVVMGLHHAITGILIGLCLLCDFTRMGSVILLLHDVNDVIMEMAKICSYTSRHSIANCLFVVFIACWFALRLVVFPAIILRSTIYESFNVIGKWIMITAALPILITYKFPIIRGY